MASGGVHFKVLVEWGDIKRVRSHNLYERTFLHIK